LTKRFDGYPKKVLPSIEIRYSINPGLENISSIHYSVFLNLVFAHQHLDKKFLSSLEILQKLSRDDFLEKAGRWYDENYSSLYHYYLEKGKSPPLKLISRKDIFTEYFGRQSQRRKKYARLSQAIRSFRNVVVHDVKIARLISQDGKLFVPKLEKIKEYRTWRKVMSATREDIERDFVEQYSQAQSDVVSLEKVLNSLWEKVLADFNDEFSSKERTALRDLYDIEFLQEKQGPIIIGDSPTHAGTHFVRPSGVFSKRDN